MQTRLRQCCLLAMRLDPLLKTERATLVLEAIGDDKVRISCSSWDHPVVMLANEASKYSVRKDDLCNALHAAGRVPEH
jgi:hypothetical protein